MGDIDHRFLLTLRTEHLKGIFLLAESIIDTTQIGIGMIAALVVEGMPLTTTDKLTLTAIHHAISVCQ